MLFARPRVGFVRTQRVGPRTADLRGFPVFDLTFEVGLGVNDLVGLLAGDEWAFAAGVAEARPAAVPVAGLKVVLLNDWSRIGGKCCLPRLLIRVEER